MKKQADKKHRYRVNTKRGVRYLNEKEKSKLMNAVFTPTKCPKS